jgi:hypothetical protein
MRFDDLFGGIDTTAAARPDGQMHLQLSDGSNAAIDDFADLPVGYGVTDADVHGVPRLPITTHEAYSVPNANANASYWGAGRGGAPVRLGGGSAEYVEWRTVFACPRSSGLQRDLRTATQFVAVVIFDASNDDERLVARPRHLSSDAFTGHYCASSAAYR